MSVEKNTYGIVGYNLTEYRDKICTEENCESDWYEDLRCYQRVGKIQIFDDPMSSEYLYFGYIFFETDEYGSGDETHPINLTEINAVSNVVKDKLIEYFRLQIGEPQVIIFNEYT